MIFDSWGGILSKAAFREYGGAIVLFGHSDTIRAEMGKAIPFHTSRPLGCEP